MAFLSIIRWWHKREHVPIREISRRLGVSRNTIRKYLPLIRRNRISRSLIVRASLIPTPRSFRHGCVGRRPEHANSVERSSSYTVTWSAWAMPAPTIGWRPLHEPGRRNAGRFSAPPVAAPSCLWRLRQVKPFSSTHMGLFGSRSIVYRESLYVRSVSTV